MPSKLIIVGVDGSDHANAALDVAAELANEMDALLVILHVAEPVYEERARQEPENLRRMEHNERTEHEILQDSERSLLAAAAKRARAKGVTRIEEMVEVGYPAELILRVAGARNATMVVLGRRGRGPMASIVLGSVSFKVTQASSYRSRSSHNLAATTSTAGQPAIIAVPCLSLNGRSLRSG
jgi:nucleotide-binding universal stress UspA family protein